MAIRFDLAVQFLSKGRFSPAAIQQTGMQRAEEINLEIKTLQHAYSRAELNAGGGWGRRGVCV